MFNNINQTMFTPLTCVATATLSVCWAYRTYWALLWYSWRRRSCSTAVLRNLLWIRAKRLAATLSEEADIAAASGNQLSSVKTINRDHQTNPGYWRMAPRGSAHLCGRSSSPAA